MSNLSKLVIVSVVGVTCYYTFVEKRNPFAEIWVNPIEEANKDYVRHQMKNTSLFADNNATKVVQDDTSGSQ